jgi:hypothetical protein
MEGSSNQSVDSAASRRSGNITYTSHLCPFSLPTSSLSTILGRDKAIVFLSLMLVLVSHILKRAKLHLRKKKKKTLTVTQPVGYDVVVLSLPYPFTTWIYHCPLFLSLPHPLFLDFVLLSFAFSLCHPLLVYFICYVVT